MSAAGLDRVKATHSQLLSDSAANSLSSTRSTRGNSLIASDGRKAAQNFSTSGAGPRPYSARYLGACNASTPGRHRYGSVNPSGNRRAGTSAGSERRVGPAAAITTLDPALRPLPE